jgi:hypothetical protein
MDSHKDLKTGFLYATPSFMAGVGRVLDLWGIFDEYNSSTSDQEADAIALYSDWRITGQDLRDAANDFVVHGYVQGAACKKCGRPIGEIIGHLPDQANDRTDGTSVFGFGQQRPTRRRMGVLRNPEGRDEVR